MKIHLHIGVHKTATTFIQGRLNANMLKLNKAGIGYLPLWNYRSSFWRDIMEIDPETFNIDDHIETFFPKAFPSEVRGLVFSEENLVGLCGTMLKSGRLFIGARPRLAHFRRLMTGHELTMFCAVRSYDSFLASAYCEGLRSNKSYVTFEEFRGRLNWRMMNWRAMTERFEEGLQPEHVKLWQYEAFRANPDPVLSELAFGETLDAPLPANTVAYPSFSQTAIEAIDCVAEKLGREVAGALARPIGASLLKTEGYPAFDPWGPDETFRLQRRYAHDCRAIQPEKWLLPPIEDVPKRRKAA